MTLHSALYVGETWHRRHRPVEHFLRYRLFMTLIDLDERDAVNAAQRVLGYDRRGPLSFRERDHGDGSTTPLRAQIEGHLAAAGLPAGGPIRVLCMPRVLGQVFNPLTVYFCYRPDDPERLGAILYEVNNTFGQRHSYLLTAEPEEGGAVAHACDKQFYVSPFMDMGLTYRFRVRPPSPERDSPLSIHIEVDQGDERILTAAFNARREPLTDAALTAALFRHPLLMAKVVGAIHWEALKLWIKGMKLRPRPTAPAGPVSFGSGRARLR